MATEQQLIEALRKADAAGDVKAAQAIARRIAETRQGAIAAEPMASQSMVTRSDAQRPVRIREDNPNSPIRGMSTFDRWSAGTGSGFNDLYLGMQQIGANIADAALPGDPGFSEQIDSRLEEKRRLDAPLDATTAGQWGKVTAGAASMIGPGSLAKAAGAPAAVQRALMPTTARGNAIQGAVFGGVSPALSVEERAGNIAFGAAGGYAGGRLGEAIGSAFKAPAPKVDPQKLAALSAAQRQGYALAPSEIGAGTVLRSIEGMSGKQQIGQALSTKNQAVTNRVAKAAIGLPEDAPLTLDALQAIRDQAADAYRAVGSIGEVRPNLTYFRAINAIDKDARTAARSFPNAAPSPLSALVEELKTTAFDAKAGIAKIRELRALADKSYRQGDNEMGRAAKKAAGAIEGAIEDHLRKIGNAEGLKAFRDARQLIAKTYTVQKALNTETGNVSAKVIGDLKKKGAPLSGGLEDIGKIGASFEKSTQMLKDPYRALSPFDLWAGAAGVGSMNPWIVAGTLGRPGARSALGSDAMQSMMMRNATQGYSVIPPLPAIVRNSAPARAGNAAQRRALPAVGYGLLSDEEDRY